MPSPPVKSTVAITRFASALCFVSMPVSITATATPLPESALMLPAPFHAFFGVIVIMSNQLLLSSYAHPPASWGVDPLYDQGAAGGIAWSFGEFPTVLVLAVVFFSWTRSEERANRVADRAYDRAIARGESGEDPALAAYNERLRRLAAHNP